MERAREQLEAYDNAARMEEQKKEEQAKADDDTNVEVKKETTDSKLENVVYQ